MEGLITKGYLLFGVGAKPQDALSLAPLPAAGGGVAEGRGGGLLRVAEGRGGGRSFPSMQRTCNLYVTATKHSPYDPTTELEAGRQGVLTRPRT